MRCIFLWELLRVTTYHDQRFFDRRRGRSRQSHKTRRNKEVDEAASAVGGLLQTSSLFQVLIIAAATELSWAQPYIGDASEALWNHIAYHTYTKADVQPQERLFMLTI